MTRGAIEKWGKRTPPKDVAYYYSEYTYSPLEPVFWNDIFDKRTAKQNSNVKNKRMSSIIEEKPAYVWVFYNSGFPYGGWWLYIKSLKKEYALNFKSERWDLVSKVLNFYPCGVLIFNIKEDSELSRWMKEFEKLYHRHNSIRNKYALAPCRITVNGYSDLIDIIDNKW